MFIDAHTHLKSREADATYLERMVGAERAIGVEKFVTFGAGPAGEWASNDEVLAAAEKYPEAVIPFAYVTLGQVTPKDIEDCVRRGFKGFKFINPTAPYSDIFYMRVYAKLEELGVPAYFHTGIVASLGDERGFDLDTYRHKVIHLDRILRRFPGLVVFAAHLGNPDYGEAGMLTRWYPNLYFDLSGSTLKKKGQEFFRELLWWSESPERASDGKAAKKKGGLVLGTYNNDPLGRGPWEKIVFGTDVAPEKVAEVKADYDRLVEALGLPERLKAAIFGGTAASALKLQSAGGI